MIKKTLEVLLPLIKEFEGCKLKSYKCPAGVWTIGYGCTGVEVCEGLTWSQTNADQHLLNTATEVIKQVLEASPTLEYASLDRVVAISDFVFNLGIGNYKRSTLKLRVDQANWVSAATEIKRWNKCNGKVLSGLINRREKEANLLSH